MSLTDGGRGFGTTTGNLKRLVVAVDENAAVLPDVSVEKAEVQSALSDADEAIRRQDFHLAQRRQATIDVRTALVRGLDAGIRLQNAVRFKLGTKSEKLLEFQLKPKRKRQSPAVTRATEAEKENEVLKEENEVLKERLAKSEESSNDVIKGDKAT